MKVADYLVDVLIKHGVTDVFGIPGSSVLDFLYALDKRKEISPHLSYHEQAAAFAASGYAQVEGTLGVAYATKGPGVTNLVTGIADAYQESIPVLFVVAHSVASSQNNMRMEADQELDTVALTGSITKYATKIDEIKDVVNEVKKACREALNGRKGPVLLDFGDWLWQQEILDMEEQYKEKQPDVKLCLEDFYEMINSSQKPIILVGAGVQLSNAVREVKKFAEKHNIPIVSSRGSQDLLADSDLYFGYIGSHATRYSNFVLSKTDFILALGNRMSFPIKSDSFAPIVNRAKTVRVDIDENEFARKIPNSKLYKADVKNFLNEIDDVLVRTFDDEWIATCKKLKEVLEEFDVEQPVAVLAEMMSQVPEDAILVGDVGNNEFWVSRAYAYSGITNRILYSRVFGALGCALPKAIGAYYKTGKRVLCFTGDQGLQINIQEMEYIVNKKLPITIILVNNHSSGMIRSRQKNKYNRMYLHTTKESEYGIPDFGKIAQAYGFEYRKIDVSNVKQIIEEKWVKDTPYFIELSIDAEIDLDLSLPKGKECQDLEPAIDRTLYNKLCEL